MSSFEEHTKKIEFVYSKIKETLNPESLPYLLDTRAYFHKEQENLLNEMEIYRCEREPNLTEIEKEILKEMGCYSENGYFILEGRFIIPVYSASGRLLTLIGWLNDTRKYVTLPTPFFSKKVDWFNLDNALELSFSAYDGVVFVTEGIFDTLSLRAIGLPAIATMGADVSNSKGELLKIFNKVVAIPDNDKTGKRAIRDRYKAWTIPYSGTFLELRGKVKFDEQHEYPVKDVDNLVSWFDVQGVRGMLLEIAKSTDKYEILDL